jgi:Tfp pilus tip-associated adhesin PilY1
MHFKVVATANAGSTTTQNFPPQVQDSVDIGGGFVSACLSNANSLGAVACPAPNPQTTQSINGNQTTTTTVNWSNCGWSVHSTTGCTGNKKKFFKSATKTTTTSITTTNNTATQTTLGYTSGCFSSQATCSTAEFAATCASYSGGCACVSEDATATAATCPTGKARHQVLGNYTVTQALPVGTYSSSPNTANGDEWAKFLHQKGVKLSDGSKAYVTTYTIDVFNAQQSAEQTQLLRNMAAHGGGRYFAAQNEGAILDALNSIFAEVQAVNSTFASASLPVNSTNRAQNANEVYLGIFRPDPSAYPRWYGNTKRYQLKNVDGGIVLADSSGNPAVNPLTGFLSDCAKSFWTTDSGKFWFDIPSSPPAEGSCTSAGTDPFSDSPDGPFVEKGSVAEVLRKGNDPGGPETFKVNRKLLSDVGVANGGALGLLNTPPASDSNFELIRFLKGFDEADEDNDGIDEETRASIHGDVIHSRPLPINHGGSIGTVLYYGSNDMTYRAVRASDGKELWAFVPEEFSTKFDEMKRLRTNQPIVKYPNESASASSKPKSYFVDGSTGTYQSAFDTDLSDGFTPSNVWIYPTLRRGGRMVYALDVTSPDVPKKKWKFGCPNATDDFGCTDGASGIGQTWSLPSPAFISGFSPGTPALIFGGGYDSCEDANSSTPGCGSAKGKKVFILNADTGAVLRSFSTERSVAADPALVDYTGDGKADFAYMVDTGGAIYRVDFINPSTKAPLDSSLWSMKKIAFTKGSGRKFLFPPALLSVKGDKIYVAIGSGDREHPIRAYYPYTEPVVNRFYVYVDDLADSTSPATDMDKDVAMKDLSDDASCETEKVTPSGKLKGWYKDLNDHGKGEQVVTSAVIVAGLVTFSTNRPIPESEGSCSTPLGEARGYLLNLFNSSGAIGVAGSCGGAQSAIFPGGGLPPSPVLATVPIDGVTTTVLIGAPQKSGAQSSPIEAQKIDPTIKSKRSRVYWNLPIDPE